MRDALADSLRGERVLQLSVRAGERKQGDEEWGWKWSKQAVMVEGGCFVDEVCGIVNNVCGVRWGLLLRTYEKWADRIYPIREKCWH